jgi:hypothetical protein
MKNRNIKTVNKTKTDLYKFNAYINSRKYNIIEFSCSSTSNVYLRNDEIWIIFEYEKKLKEGVENMLKNIVADFIKYY